MASYENNREVAVDGVLVLIGVLGMISLAISLYFFLSWALLEIAKMIV